MRHIESIVTESNECGRMAACILQAAPEAAMQGRRFALEACAGWCIIGDLCESLRMIVSELVTNAATHSGSCYVALILRISTNSIQIEVVDSGQWQIKPQEENAESGRGLQIVEALSEKVAFLPTTVGTRVRADLPITSPDQQVSSTSAPDAGPYEDHVLTGSGAWIGTDLVA
ncbi:ATP-binding protein [Streptomyces sp. NPDC006475]|uniref:ATP-binding protein n=1 Tax=Streptomyces sp. NPDC006475 TaxID=3155719 RepID=UPI0033AB1D28